MSRMKPAKDLDFYLRCLQELYAYFPTGPFEDAYLPEQLDLYGRFDDYESDGLKVKWKQPVGRLDDYLNVNFRVNMPEVPCMWIDDVLWMSLTYMEAQSMALHAFLAEGYVGTAGLGLGYFPLKVAMKPEVMRVTVYEQDPRVIRFFKEVVLSTVEPEVESKIKIIEGDARRARGERFDYFLADIYDSLCCDEMLDDFEIFPEIHDIEEYGFWTQELLLLSATTLDDACEVEGLPSLTVPESWYLTEWMKSPLQSLYRPMSDDEYIVRALKLMGRI